MSARAVDIPHIISFLSTGTTIEKGTVIVTGTPTGIGYTQKPPVLLQDGDAADIHPSTHDPDRNAANIKDALYFLGVDAVGLSACPYWTYYSNEAAGQQNTTYHTNAI